MRISTQRVRELRHAQTEAEKAAWHSLRDRRLGLKFRRQYPIENYVIDFYCCEIRLAVELDGGIHSQPSQMIKDAAKDAFLGKIGVRVLRLPNGLVIEDPEGFVRKVREAAAMVRGKGRGRN
ncbi:MAG TPA: endonuclease domain-containing protein [Terriglobales bacterium]|nr:endonuclease domain-containing protein [Terriglobales bacterium]